MSAAWHELRTELSRARDAGRTVRVWLRDDDAVTVTPALDRLHGLCAAVGLPILLAIIPAGADGSLAAWVACRPAVAPCQHGWRHANHAPPGERAREIGGARAAADIIGDLARGRERLGALFGRRLAPVLVPPWNRIDEALLPALPALGFSTLSTFGPPPRDPGPIARRNSDLDIVDWRHGRRGRTIEDCLRRLAPLVAAALDEGRPVGLLTHHLAHDGAAWAVLEDVLSRFRGHEAVRFVGWDGPDTD